jgi:WD40 repeat protein
VLIAGGDNGTSPLNSAELYDPATGKFATTGSMTAARRWHAATLLRNGRVLLTGGWKDSSAALSSAELYDPGSGTFSATSDMKIARCLQTAALLSDGRVLLTGGKDGPVSTATAELYQP